jgi:hypothetical protein
MISSTASMERGCSCFEVVSWDEVDKAQRQMGGGFRLPRDPAGYLHCARSDGRLTGFQDHSFFLGRECKVTWEGLAGGQHGRLAGGPATGPSGETDSSSSLRGRPVPLSGLVANSRLAPTVWRLLHGEPRPSRNSKKRGCKPPG